MDGWMSQGFTSLQQYFSHFETMEEWTWKALCNEAPFGSEMYQFTDKYYIIMKINIKLLSSFSIINLKQLFVSFSHIILYRSIKVKKNELKITRVWGCSIFWPPAPPHGIYPGVSSYGMEADPPRFLNLKDECFLMTDWCDTDISLIMTNSKSVTLTSRSVRKCGVVTE